MGGAYLCAHTLELASASLPGRTHGGGGGACVRFVVGRNFSGRSFYSIHFGAHCRSKLPVFTIESSSTLALNSTYRNPNYKRNGKSLTCRPAGSRVGAPRCRNLQFPNFANGISPPYHST